MTTQCLLLSLLLGVAAADTRPGGEAAASPFFAMDTSTRDEQHQTVEQQLRLVKELGFSGWACNLPLASDATLQQMDSLGLRLFAVYTGLEIGDEAQWDAALPETIRRLKGRETRIWLFITSKGHAAGSSAADDKAVEGLRRIAAMAAESGLKVSIYPHNGFYVAATRDALRIIRKAGLPELMVTFNLCHWLKVDKGKDLDGVLRDARPYLDIVTINGADGEGENWDRLIKPLGDGDFDVLGLLVKLQKLEFKGPVGLQGYGIKGSVRAHLGQAMRVWRDYSRRIAGRGGPSAAAYRAAYVADAGIQLDARLDEPAWARARAETAFTFPWKRAAAPRTEFRAVCDREHLYFAFQVEDADICVLDKLRDEEDAVFEDRVEMYFSADDAMRNYYCLEIDSRGRVFDYRGAYYRQLDPKWSLPEVEASGATREGGYVIEGRMALAGLEKLGLPRLQPGAKLRVGIYRAEFSHDHSGRAVEQHESIHNRGRRSEGPPLLEEWISWIDPRTEEPDFHVPASLGWLEVTD